jgi:predicted RNA-binding Zn-ribbon protein involved in translation (DUF1610 family)
MEANIILNECRICKKDIPEIAKCPKCGKQLRHTCKEGDIICKEKFMTAEQIDELKTKGTPINGHKIRINDISIITSEMPISENQIERQMKYYFGCEKCGFIGKKTIKKS